MSKVVCVLSPFRASEKRSRAEHLLHARALCLRLARAGFIPYASHLFAPQFLDDDVPEDRDAGINISKEMIRRADEVWVWDFWGISSGMKAEIEEAMRLDKTIFFASRPSQFDEIRHVWNDLLPRAA